MALLNATGGVEAFYVFLTAVGYALFLIFIVRPLYRRLCVATGSLEHGPSPLLMRVTLLMVLVSAFVTDIIGIHPIFGGFLAGALSRMKETLQPRLRRKLRTL